MVTARRDLSAKLVGGLVDEHLAWLLGLTRTKGRKMSITQIEANDLAIAVGNMDRCRVIHEIEHFQGRFPLDFTSDHLENLTAEQLRHILLAAKMQDLSD